MSHAMPQATVSQHSANTQPVNAPESPCLATKPHITLSMDQGKASPELGCWMPSSKSKVTAGRMVVMAQLKNGDCC